MKVHTLERVQHVPLDVDQTFRFYGEIGNLERITPAWLRFRILYPRPHKLTAGARLEYTLRLHRFPIRWTTQIDRWEPPNLFTDFQERGPYRLWEHTHTFEQAGSGTRVTDTVRYALPYGPLGALAHVAFVRRDLRRIFDFRRDTVAALLGDARAAARP